MRVIAGRWKGRPIRAPRGRGTRPTSDRVREGVFSTVYSAIGSLEGLEVADLYAGSGALGLEALSRGAARAVFVENDRAALEALRSNIAALGADPRSVRVVSGSARSPGVVESLRGPFALLFFDPPYRIDTSEVAQLLAQLAAAGSLAPGALVVYEHASGVDVQWPTGFAGGAVKRYGVTAVSFATYGSEG